MIALVVTPEGLPLAYEVLPGNTADSKTLRTFLGRIEKQYGKARRVWVMDRGVPTEAVLAEMRASDPPVQYLVGTPKGRLNRLEKHLIEKPWQKARAGVEVKLLAQDDELYVFAQSADRVAKERAMRRRQLKSLWARLGKLAAMNVKREEMLMKLGAARSKAPTAWRLVEVALDKESAALTFSLNRQKLRIARRREGRYLLRTNLTDKDPAVLVPISLVITRRASSFVGKFAREELAQHVGDRQPALERGDLDAPALFGSDVDGESGGENVALAVIGRDRIGLPNPCLCVARPCYESALGIAAAHRAILTTSAASDMISRVAGPTSSSSPASLPVRAASAKITRWPIREASTGGS